MILSCATATLAITLVSGAEFTCKKTLMYMSVVSEVLSQCVPALLAVAGSDAFLCY